MTRRRQQAVVAAALSAALLAASFASVAMAGGSLPGPGPCLLQVKAYGHDYASSTVVVPHEEFLLRARDAAGGEGPGEMVAENAKLGIERRFPVFFGPRGDFIVAFAFDEASVGSWVMTVTEEGGVTCSSQVEVEVLPLTDVAESKSLVDIKWLFLEGITSGCTPTTFCPNGLVSRGQMATFLVRALGLPPTLTDFFTDDEESVHEPNINRLRAAGITSGCTATTFCPNGLVTRAQMATFLVRAFNLPPTSTDYFADDESNKHEVNINRLRAARITFGCNARTAGLDRQRFCPDAIVTRGQMATFLHRAIE